MVEDNVPFAEENPWRLPDKFEINDALATVQQLGGTVARSYVITVERTNDRPACRAMCSRPGKFNEDAFRTMDEVLAAANHTGVRLIIPARGQLGLAGRSRRIRRLSRQDQGRILDRSRRLIADFEQTIHFILTRTNTITGVRYCDDKSILCWETGNELVLACLLDPRNRALHQNVSTRIIS